MDHAGPSVEQELGALTLSGFAESSDSCLSSVLLPTSNTLIFVGGRLSSIVSTWARPRF